MAIAQTSPAPANPRMVGWTGDAARLRDLAVGPDGFTPEQFEALLAGWEPGESTLVQFLVARGVLERTGAQTLGAVLKGYVQLRGPGLCHLFKPLPAGPDPAPVLSRTATREPREPAAREPGPREAPGRDSPHSTPSTAAASAFSPRPAQREGSRPHPVAAVPEARSTSAAPDAPRSETPAQEFARLSLRAQISELRAELAGRAGRGPARHPSEPGDRCGHYALLRRIGEGAHSLVFQARHEHDQRLVVLKLPRPDAAAASLPRFAGQAQIHARLVHAGVMPLLEAGGRDGRVYLAYADMGAVPITSYLRQLTGRLQVWTLAQLFVDVAQVLGAAAKVGVLHGDLTPANILMCDHDARLRLTDFGMRIPGAPAGPFTAPELAAGAECTSQADMYSLGVALQHAAIGQAAPAALVQQRRPDLPPALVELLDRMTARAPQDRPGSWDAAIAAVQAACPRVAGPQPSPRL